MSQALIIDDSADFRASARQLLETEGYTVTEAATGAEGIRIADELTLELVLLDIQLPDLDGFEVAKQLACLERPPQVVLTSTRDRATTARSRLKVRREVSSQKANSPA